MRDDKINVIYIAGAGRSGSTLFDRMLGEIAGVAALGEVRFLWERGFLSDYLCGCGDLLRECRFWSTVVSRVFDPISGDEMRRVAESARRAGLSQNTPPVRGFLATKSFLRDHDSHIQTLGKLYRAIADVSGANWIVDSSKVAWYGFLLSKAPNVRVSVVHLVRDSRGYVFSTMRKKRRTEISGRIEYTPVIPLQRSATDWIVNNLAADSLKYSGLPYIRIRYEDIVKEPKVQIMKVLEHCGFGRGTNLDFIRDDKIYLQASHAVPGNPDRVQSGAVPLRIDDEWRRAMARPHYYMTTLLSLPLLWRYGYLR